MPVPVRAPVPARACVCVHACACVRAYMFVCAYVRACEYVYSLIRSFVLKFLLLGSNPYSVVSLALASLSSLPSSTSLEPLSLQLG